jgi:hypothetical protein
MCDDSSVGEECGDQDVVGYQAWYRASSGSLFEMSLSFTLSVLGQVPGEQLSLYVESCLRERVWDTDMLSNVERLSLYPQRTARKSVNVKRQSPTPRKSTDEAEGVSGRTGEPSRRG